jgi:hypothetical protein
VPRALLLAAALLTQAPSADLDDIVWDAVRPSLPFPEATDEQVPIDGSTTARWIVRRAGEDEDPLVAEVLANPLNRATQERAKQDMAAIQQEVFAAERRAQVEFERARETARRSGAPVSVHGVTLDDEGVAGDRADADERMTIEIETGRAEHVARLETVDAPVLSDMARGAAWLLKVGGREIPREGEPRSQYFPAQAVLYFSSAKPVISETARHIYTVRASGGRNNVIAVILRGNSELIDRVIGEADWNRVILRRP